MTTSTIELSMDQMNAVNGGFNPIACALGTIFGAAKGALACGALGLAAGPVGAAAGALIGGIVGGNYDNSTAPNGMKTRPHQ